LVTNQIIEADNTINFYNNYLSLSFWVKSNKTGAYSVQFRASGSVSVTTPNLLLKYNINAADTWEYKTLIIPPQNLSLITNGNGSGYNLFFTLASGQNKNMDAAISNVENKWGLYSSSGIAFTDQTNLMSTAGNYWQVTNVQLEVGRNATEFEHRSYGEELALCQRYFQRIGRQGFGGTSKNDYIASGFVDSGGTNFYGGANLKVSMRTSPTISVNGTIGHISYTHPSAAFVANNLANYWSNPESYVVRFTSASGGGTTGYGGYVRIDNDATQLEFSAEL